LRYIVIGAGSVGGTIGGLLARAGHDVVLVARGAHLDVLRSAGLTLATPAQTFTVRPPAVAGPEDLRLTSGDVLLLAMKGQDTAAVVAAWNSRPVDSSAGGGSLAADRLPVFCVQNGVENERVALRRFAHVYGVGVQLPAELTGPGHVMAAGSPVAGVLEIGRYPSGTGEAAVRFAADLNESGFVARVTDRVMDFKYTKLLRNLRNAIIAACGSMDSDAAKELAALAVAEAEACYRVAGISHLDLRDSNAAREDVMREVAVNGRRRGGGSSWQSLHRQAGSVETDYLNGEIVLLGRLHGVATPVNELLRQTASLMAERRQQPGAHDPQVLLALARAGGDAPARAAGDPAASAD
jgi:2-dehydropantoate 2-reductase